MNFNRLLTFFILAVFATSCIPITAKDNSINELNKNPNISNVFSYYDKNNNVQFTALMSGKLVLKNGCLFLNDGENLITPIFNSEHVELDIVKKKFYMDQSIIPLNDNLLFGGGFLNSESLPELDTRASDACLTSRVAILHSIVEDTPEFRKRWLIPN